MVLRDGRTEAIPDLLALVAGFPVVEERATQADVDQHDAILGVLDALIQLGAQVPTGDAQRTYPEFPCTVYHPAVTLPGRHGARAAGHLQ